MSAFVTFVEIAFAQAYINKHVEISWKAPMLISLAYGEPNLLITFEIFTISIIGVNDC